jgi:hypothetical protein
VDKIARQVALKYAAYFELGTKVLYGKYKNKVGIVKAFGKDKWGNPTIEIEPVPKGRKQNKVLGLYKIWRADVKEKALAEKEKMDKVTARVVNAYYRKQALDVGRTWENENWRIHRYADSITITELRDAGKRGKKVKVISLYGGVRSLPMESMAMEMVMLGKRDESYARMLQAAKEAAEIGFGLSEREERGVDVAPGNFGPLDIRGKHVHVQVGWKDFSVKNTDDKYNEETCIPAMKGGLKAIPAFYRWVSDNRAKIEGMVFTEVLKAMEDLGVPYHQYCAMD